MGKLAFRGLRLNRLGAMRGDSASLSLNFLAGVMDPRITFTRASTATYFNSDGLLRVAAVDVPRFDYDPVTLQLKGLLVEGPRTNLLLRSAEFDNAVWIKGAGAAVTANAISSPTGGEDADLITISSADNGVYENIAVTSSTVYTFSWYVRLGTLAAANYKYAIYDNTAGTMVNVDVVPSQTPTAGGWTRIIYTFTTPVGCLSVRVYPFRNASATAGTYYLWGAQAEARAAESSYIPTTSATVTLAADVVQVLGANFSSWFNASEGTFVVEVMRELLSATGYILTASRSPVGLPRIQVSFSVTDRIDLAVVDDAESVSVAGIGAVVPGVGPNRFAAAYKVNDFANSVNGGAVVTDITGAPPTGLSLLNIGADWNKTRQLFGHIRRIDYYRTRLSNAELQRLST